MDEAGRTTQPPLIMAPGGLDVAPDAEAADKATPMPADTVGPAKKGAPKNGSAKPAPGRTADSKPEPATETTVEAKAGDTNGHKPSFVRPDPPTPAPPAAPAPAAPESTPASVNWAAPAYPGTSSGYQATSAAATPDYTRSDWPTSQEQRTAVQPPVTSPSGTSPSGTGTEAPGPADPAAGGFSSVSNFGSAAATAVTGTATGLAGSVTSAWRKRGSKNDSDKPRAQVRKPTKRQAMLTLARVEPWSVMKFSFVASVVAFIIIFVAVAVLYMVLSALGVFDSIQNTVNSITSSKGTAGTNISHWFSASLILGYTAMLGALNIVLITAISTIGSVIYNLIAKTVGGIEVTLRETD